VAALHSRHAEWHLRRGGDAAHRTLAVGQAGDKSEEEEDAATVIREKERFSNELTLVFCTGEITILIGLEETRILACQLMSSKG